ncbi:MAG TPA: helix-turn-helix domain-containing protein [Gemmatimonadales bacterium]|nr:helix-turn-helix domain-containing protein [Gemmatimonadales bacterium]
MSVTLSDNGSGTNGVNHLHQQGGGEWVSVTEAAHLARVSERTVQRWIEGGKVVSDMSDEGRRRVRRSSLPPACLLQSNSSLMSDVSDEERLVIEHLSDTLSDVRHDTVECPTSNDSTHSLSDTAARSRAESAERERDRLASEVEFLRAQLVSRTQAEEQLRVMMAHLESTNAELARALVQRALPPAPDFAPAPRRTRWWSLWRRR